MKLPKTQAQLDELLHDADNAGYLRGRIEEGRALKRDRAVRRQEALINGLEVLNRIVSNGEATMKAIRQLIETEAG